MRRPRRSKPWGARLIETDLTGAFAIFANLTGAVFVGAKLSSAVVDQDQLDSAIGDEQTQLPPKLSGRAPGPVGRS